MARSKKISGYMGSATEISLPTSVSGNLIREISTDAFKDKGITKIITNAFSDSLTGYPWGATGAEIECRDKTIMPTFTITCTLSNVTADSSNPISMVKGTTATLLFSAASSYKLPDSISVSGAEYTYNKDNGTVILSNATGNITISITGVLNAYNITCNLTNCTGAAGNPTTITPDGSATLTFTANSGYILSDVISVSGATYV